MNVENWHLKNIKLGATACVRSSTGNCAINRKFSVLTNGIYINQKLYLKMKRVRSSGTLRYNHPIQARRPDLVLINKKKRPCYLEDFIVPESQRMKVKEDEKQDKYLDRA